MPAKQNKLQQVKKLIDTAHASIESARQILSQVVGDTDDSAELAAKAQAVGSVSQTEGEKIIEGIFDGQNMVGPDGKQYSVPANYASKSKLVLGDTLKLTITVDGTFMYKQIGPVERQRVVGMLTKDDTTDEYRVVVGDTTYRVLLASVTYFKGEPGDEVVLLVPKGQTSEWGAVENIIKAGTAAPVSRGEPIATEATEAVAAPASPGEPVARQPVEEIEDLG